MMLDNVHVWISITLWNLKMSVSFVSKVDSTNLNHEMTFLRFDLNKIKMVEKVA